MATTKVSRSIPPATGALAQAVYNDTVGNDIPSSYNEGNAGGWKFAHISTATTTLVLTGAGWLRKIHVPGTGGTPGNITIYDALTATGNPIYGPTTPSAGQIIDIQRRVGTGITVVTAAATVCDVAYDQDATF